MSKEINSQIDITLSLYYWDEPVWHMNRSSCSSSKNFPKSKQSFVDGNTFVKYFSLFGRNIPVKFSKLFPKTEGVQSKTFSRNASSAQQLHTIFQNDFWNSGSCSLFSGNFDIFHITYWCTPKLSNVNRGECGSSNILQLVSWKSLCLER